MKANARFKNEIRCMDLAYVDKLAEDNTGVKYLLVRQDLFDRTVDAKEFLKKIPGNVELMGEENLLESLKNYATLRDYQFTLQ